MPETKTRKVDMQTFNTARDFFTSTRGQYITGKAFHIAIEALESANGVLKEEGTIADMRFFRDELFPMYTALQEETIWKAKLILKGLAELEGQGVDPEAYRKWEELANEAQVDADEARLGKEE